MVTPGVDVDYPYPLEEGVHFLRAHTPADIDRINHEIDQMKWERMSNACWDWFEAHGTIDAIFKDLHMQIQNACTNLDRHRCIRILATKEAALDSIAAKSLQIMDPQAYWLSQEDDGDCKLSVDPDELIINELPLVEPVNTYQWKVSPADQRCYCDGIDNSNLEAHKRILEMMNLRFKNFRIKVTGEEGSIPLWERLCEEGIYLRSSTEKAILTSDYDSLRNCAGPYEYIEHEITGPALVTIPMIQATLHCSLGENEFIYDLSSHFSDYYAMHGELIPPEKVVRTCKLWKFADCEFKKVVGTVYSKKTGVSEEFLYLNPQW